MALEHRGDRGVEIARELFESACESLEFAQARQWELVLFTRPRGKVHADAQYERIQFSLLSSLDETACGFAGAQPDVVRPTDGHISRGECSGNGPVGARQR